MRQRAYPRVWRDPDGQKWVLPRPGKKLSPSIRAGHARIREFVFVRDGFTCQICGISAEIIPDEYDGRMAPWTPTNGPLHLDHIVPRKLKGSNHPNNLQTLCESCNSRKAAH